MKSRHAIRFPRSGAGAKPWPLQDIGARLVADFVSQIAQGANDPPVSPTPILPGQLEHQILDRLARRRTAPRQAAL